MNLARIVLFAAAAALALPAVAQTKSEMQLLAEKIRADKRLLVARNMQLTEAQAKGFWPVYEAYQKDLQAINQRLLASIRNYAAEHRKAQLSDETANKLINEALAIEEAEVKLKRSYLPKLEKVLPGVKLARYLQIENKIRAVVRHDLAAEIPLVQ